MIDFTPIAKLLFKQRCAEAASWDAHCEKVQREQLHRLIKSGRGTIYGASHHFDEVVDYESFKRLVPITPYEDIRPLVMRMVNGEKDVLWPGVTHNFAQSSGTSGGKSKYIPITADGFKNCHYKGAADVVAHYLNLYPDSHIFSGKSFILGGSFANELNLPVGVRVGDLSANLIDNVNPTVNLVRIPSKDVALMENWQEKLPKLVEASIHENVTNISGVPSWFLTVLREVIKAAGATTIHDVWPNLEVFFHGGIAFAPYRALYESITDRSHMRYLNTYNASEGFFAVQSAREDDSMLLLLDVGVFYEFIPFSTDGDLAEAEPLAAWEVEEGKIYELVITNCNGLWRYPIGDTVKIESVRPLKISIAGRTKHYINAFGEELMVHNADAGITRACQDCKCHVVNYTAAPVYTTEGAKGHHQWLIEFDKLPESIEAFADSLDRHLCEVNSDYQAKRSNNIFLGRLEITVAHKGLFDRWLATTGKLGGQRKIPRLSNDRRVIDKMIEINEITKQ
jgi:hypothetical protein